MSKRLGTVALAAAVLVGQVGCYTTKIVTPRAPEGREYSDRQWFTLGGLVPLSSPAGRECQHGLSSAKSELSGTDWLINVGLGLAGGLVGTAACGNDISDPTQAAAARTTCAVAFSSLVPFLIGSRTVEYSCAGAPRQEYVQPPQQSAPPPQPAQNYAPERLSPPPTN